MQLDYSLRSRLEILTGSRPIWDKCREMEDGMALVPVLQGGTPASPLNRFSMF